MRFISKTNLSQKTFKSRSFSSTRKELVFKDSPVVTIHIAKTGEYNGREEGSFTLSKKNFDEVISNFESENCVLPIYRGHADMYLMQTGEEPPACGWIVSLFRVGSDLFAEAQFTEQMRAQIKNGEYMYSSISVVFNEVHRVTGKKIGSRMNSLAITNQPYIDGLKEIKLSKIGQFGEKDYIYKSTGSSNMTKDEQIKMIEELLKKVSESEEEMSLSAIEDTLKEMVSKDKKEEETDTTVDIDIDGTEDEALAQDMPKEEIKTEEKKEEIEVKASEVSQETFDLLGVLQKMVSEMEGTEMTFEQVLQFVHDKLSMKEEEAVEDMSTDKVGLSSYKLALSKLEKELKLANTKIAEFENEKVESWLNSQIENGIFTVDEKQDWKSLYLSNKPLCERLLKNKTPSVVLNKISEDKKGKDNFSGKFALSNLTEHEKKIMRAAGVIKEDN